MARVQAFNDPTVAEAARCVAAGQPVAVPTETVYGLAADATNPAAVAAVYAAKGRPSFNPLIVHVPDLAAAQRIGRFDALAQRLAAAFWPGPLTIVVPLREDAGIAALATAGLDTVALRVPAHRAMQAVLAASGKPLAAPSANPSGRISPTSAAHVAAGLGDRVALILDDGPTTAGIESTIVALTDGAVLLLRPGPITAEALSAALGVRVDTVAVTDDAAPSAPGQLTSHYAPTKPVRLNATSFAEDEFAIGFGPVAGTVTLSAQGNLVEAAARLFDLLHQADASDLSRIAIAPIPDDGLGQAINDRLRRAAA